MLYSTDIAVIGAGPVGLFTVFQCGMLGMKCHVIDSLEQIGGQCTALYPEKPIYDIPAYPVISGEGLIAQLETQAAPFAPVYHLNQRVVSVEKSAHGRFKLTTSQDRCIEAKAVILAAGAGAFGPNRPPLERLAEFEGKSVFYMVKRREDFADKTLVIAGGGDSAVDWTLSLAPVTKKIYFVHRRDKFRAAPESVERLHALVKTEKVDLVIPYQLHALHGTDGILSHVELADMEGGTKTLQADALLPFFGIVPQLGEIKNWGFDVELHHIPVNPTTMQTSQEGIFAIGDIATYPRKLKLILTGFAEAAQAAHAAYPLVFQGKEHHFVYSTSQGLPKG